MSAGLERLEELFSKLTAEDTFVTRSIHVTLVDLFSLQTR